MLAIIVLGVVLLAGCQSQPEAIVPREAIRADFSGSWEMDYSLNDSVEAKVDAYFYRIRRTLQRQSNNRQLERGRSGIAVNHRVAQTVLSMAQFVEKISRTQLMDIEQTYANIRIDRESTFSLACDFSSAGLSRMDTPFGVDVCGWDGHQLLFQLHLPEGLVVIHRLTLSAGGERLNVATTMMSDMAPEPFTLNRSYMRFDRRDRGYECEQTVLKGKVCRLTSPSSSPAEVPEAEKPIVTNVD